MFLIDDNRAYYQTSCFNLGKSYNKTFTTSSRKDSQKPVISNQLPSSETNNTAIDILDTRRFHGNPMS